MNALANTINVNILELSGNEDEGTCNLILKVLPKTSNKRYSAYSNLKSRLQSLSGELLARKSVADFFNTKFITEEIFYTPKGKPFFKNKENYFFNISHSSSIIVCATSCYTVGVDVENIRKISNNISKRYFTENENKYLETFDIAEYPEKFIQLWTLKESYLKAKGTGLAMELSSFSVINSENEFIITETENSEKFKLFSQKINSKTYLAVCGIGFNDVNLNYVALDDLF